MSHEATLNPSVLAHRRQQVLYDIKWKKFLKRSFPFRYLPFIDFVFGAGSMALQNVHPHSDFDVLIGTRRGRIFTVRFLTFIIFGLLGTRRNKMSHDESASDKICLNHFVTEQRFRLTPPHNAYWQKLYEHLVPLFGTPEHLDSFWKANADWMQTKPIYREDLRHLSSRPTFIKRFFEFALAGRLGDLLERFLRFLQVRRIQQSLSSQTPGYLPRIIFTNDELEFHPDTRRIEAYLQAHPEDFLAPK
jgi:hypothetical protein